MGHSARILSQLILPAIVLAMTGTAFAQTLYKYKGPNGEWIYTDRKPPEEEKPEVRELESSFIEPTFTVSHDVYGKTIEFTARNEYHAPMEVRLEFSQIVGVEYPSSDQVLRWVVEPRSDLLLLTLDVIDELQPATVEYLFEYLPGDPTAVHSASRPYVVPYSSSRSFPITQAYPDSVTHTTVDSMYAVDIAMPIGTDILAARDGVVFDVAADNYRGGLDPERDGQAANIVRILHDDGTFSLYAHLNWNSIRVQPGDKVKAGQYIADSGNTGFTSGPHLHFAVQRNAGLKIESVPMTFRGGNSTPVVPASGNVLTAYQ